MKLSDLNGAPKGGTDDGEPLGDDVVELREITFEHVEAARRQRRADLHEDGSQVDLDREGMARIAADHHRNGGADSGESSGAEPVEERLQQPRVRRLVRR